MEGLEAFMQRAQLQRRTTHDRWLTNCRYSGPQESLCGINPAWTRNRRPRVADH